MPFAAVDDSFSASDAEKIRMYADAGYSIAKTANILCRGVRDLEAWSTKNNVMFSPPTAAAQARQPTRRPAAPASAPPAQRKKPLSVAPKPKKDPEQHTNGALAHVDTSMTARAPCATCGDNKGMCEHVPVKLRRFRVRTDIPLPTHGLVETSIWPDLNTMLAGGSFFIPGYRTTLDSSLTARISRIQSKTVKRFTTVFDVEDGKSGTRVWRRPDAEGPQASNPKEE